MLIIFAIIVEIIAILVNDKPSENCLNDWKIISGNNEIATHVMYGNASSTTFSGCPILYIIGLDNSTINVKIELFDFNSKF